MGNTKKNIIRMAVVGIVLGTLITFGTLALYGFDLSRLNTINYQTNTYLIEEDFKNIKIESTECDVRLLPAETDKCEVVCVEREDVAHRVAAAEDTLTVAVEDRGRWFKRMVQFGVYVDKAEILVYLPQRDYEALYVRSLSGDIDIPEHFTFAAAEIHSSSGDIRHLAAVKRDLYIETLSGQLLVEDVSAQNLEATSSSGDVQVRSIEGGSTISLKTESGQLSVKDISAQSIEAVSGSGDLEVIWADAEQGFALQTVSGEIVLTGVRSKEISADSTSGQITFVDVVVSGNMGMETVSGDVRLEGSDGQEIAIKTVSGDVSGSLLSDKMFVTHTQSGHVDVPDSVPTGKCVITTTSGNIRLAAESSAGV